MKQRTLGRSLTVSEIGLGCMSLTGAYGATANVPREEAIALIRRAVDLGIERAPPGAEPGGSGAPRPTVEQEYVAVLLTHLLATGTLAIVGTFLVRSGILDSIHAFVPPATLTARWFCLTHSRARMNRPKPRAARMNGMPRPRQ